MNNIDFLEEGYADLEKELAAAKALLADAWTALSSVEAATFQTPGPDSLTTRIFAFLQGWKR